MEAVRELAVTAKTPSHYDKVYKDECSFCFCTAQSPGGLYVNLTTFQAFCAQHVALDQQRSGAALHLHEHARKVPLTAEEEAAQQAAPDKLAIGMQGGFDVNATKYNIEKDFALVVMPTGDTFQLPCADLPEQVLDSIAAVQAHDSANAQNQAEAWQEERVVSKYAGNLEQLPCTRTIPMDPKQWKCDDTGVTENLWLNLSTGHIGSGRPHWDGTGGTGSALHHFEQTGKKYPLVVKLGTITPSSADVYSYADDENDMVLDPDLAQHLAHWGINMMQMEKTEKTMAELQIEKNMAYEFDKITEAGSALQPLSGPGYMGLKNLGNSCYMNSVLQAMWVVPELKSRYLDNIGHIFNTSPPDVANDFLTQFAKVGAALVEGTSVRGDATTGADIDEANVVLPHAFKNVIGKGHPEFSSMRQQDAQEFFNHLLDLATRAERAAAGRLPGVDEPTSKLFEFGVETRIQCLKSQRVSYKQESTTLLGLEIPLESATNKLALEQYRERQQKRQKLKEEAGSVLEVDAERVLPRVPLNACLEKYAADELVEGYFSAFLGKNTEASKRVRFSSFPQYLMVQLRRYYVDTTWTPKKLEVLVDVPDFLDLDGLKGSGPQADEVLQPAVADREAAPALQPDASIVAQLVGMGFSENGSKRAAVATTNTSAEAAMEWVLAHMADPDFNDPIALAGNPGVDINPDSLALLSAMGFAERQATAALTACNGDAERAGDWLFSRMDDLDTAVEAEFSKQTTSPRTPPIAGDGGTGKYELVACISHMGSNTACGHYVCHIKKDGRWAIFNDEKVAVSEHPPLQLAYMYLYKRAAV